MGRKRVNLWGILDILKSFNFCCCLILGGNNFIKVKRDCDKIGSIT